MDNKVVGNRATDNKDPKNKQKPSGARGSEGAASPHGNFFKGGQNSPPSTPPSMAGKELSAKGDAGVMLQAKRQKKIIRTNTSYTDGAIARAKKMRGL